jgi:hypothetical protein
MKIIEETRTTKVLLLVEDDGLGGLAEYTKGDFTELSETFLKVESWTSRDLTEKELEDPVIKRAIASIEKIKEFREEKKRGRKCRVQKEEVKDQDTTIGAEESSAESVDLGAS